MNQVEVQIMGQAYVLGCPEGGEQRLAQAVAKVDQAMCAIRDSGKLRARDRIAVLAALNLAFDLTDAPTHAAGASAQTVTTDPADEADLKDLLNRLDQALGDGKLI